MRKAFVTTVAFLLVFMLVSLVHSQQLTEGLVAHYTFDIDEYDESGNQYDGWNLGATLVEQGVCDGAFDFNGVDNYIVLPDSLATDLDGLNTITISAWVYNRGAEFWGYRNILRMDYGSRDDTNPKGLRGIMFRLGGNPHWGDVQNKFAVVIGTDRFPTKDSAINLETIEDIPLNVWTHVAVVYDSSSVTLFVNGVAPAQIRKTEGKHTHSVVPNGDPHWGLLKTIGSMPGIGVSDHFTGQYEFWNGMIDDLKIFNTALSSIEVEQLSVCAEPPVASFTKTEEVQPGELVTFTDTSTGEITDWLWDFGDGTMSTVQNPTHVYETSGVFTVSLTIIGPGGVDTDTQNGVDVLPEESLQEAANSIKGEIRYGKTPICHTVPKKHDKTLHVSVNAVNAHLDHGDYLGECN